VKIYSLIGICPADWLYNGAEGLACFRVDAPWGCKAVYYKVYLAQVSFYQVNCLSLDFIGKCIAVYAF
jgi:hypothetical protein